MDLNPIGSPARRIALIDDNAGVRHSLRLLLSACGFDVEAFSGADEVLLDLHPSDFDCYVIDWRLDGLNGLELLSALRQKGIDAPAVLISGWESRSLEMLASQAGFRALVRKPMMDTSLVDVLRQILTSD